MNYHSFHMIKILVFLSFGILIYMSIGFVIEKYELESVRVGDEWVFSNDNPFKPKCWTNTVLEVKDGWVRYKSSNLIEEQYDEIILFKSVNVRVKKGENK